MFCKANTKSKEIFNKDSDLLLTYYYFKLNVEKTGEGSFDYTEGLRMRSMFDIRQNVNILGAVRCFYF